MSTHPGTWKQRERDGAAFFGTRRQRCSGSSGRPDCSRSDSMHDDLFVECKLREHTAVRNLYDKTKAQADKEEKTPVLLIFDKGRHGFLVVVHERDFDEVARCRAEFLAGEAAKDDD